MSDKKYTFDAEGLELMCKAIRESHSVADAIDDNSIATNSTFSSKHITDLVDAIPIFDGNADTLEGHDADYFATADDIESIIDGTQPVGDSAKLGGKEASEYVTYEFETINTSVLEKALSLPAPSMRVYKLNGDSYTGGDLPSEATYMYSDAICIKHGGNTAIVILTGYGKGAKRLAINYYAEGAWQGWDTNATTSDLANYLPISGGRLSNAKREVLVIENTAEGASNVDLRFMINGVSKGQVGVTSLGNLTFYDNANSKSYYVLHTGNYTDYSLPLSGGTIGDGGNASRPLKVKRYDNTNLGIQFEGNSDVLGSLGFLRKDNPVYANSTNTQSYSLLHTGNKPTGTYTGNGDATERRIKVGGIGKVVYVFNTRGAAIVTTGGTAVFPNGGEFTWISATTLDDSTMEIVLKTDNTNLNGSNLAFNYQVA